MTDKELIRRALMGSQEAQQACTDKGIVLPCPKCFSDGVRIEGDAHNIYDPDTLGYIDSIPDIILYVNSILYVTCDNCNLCSNCITVKDGEEREDAEKRLIAEWNTRPAPPIGRCGECKAKEKAVINDKGFLICPASGMEITDNDFCSYFEPKED